MTTQVELFGQLRIDRKPCRRREIARFLALLAFKPGRGILKNTLIERVWGENIEDGRYRQAKLVVRRLTSAKSLDFAGLDYEAFDPVDVSSDTAEFLSMVDLLRAMRVDSAERQRLLEAAYLIYQNGLLPQHLDFMETERREVAVRWFEVALARLRRQIAHDINEAHKTYHAVIEQVEWLSRLYKDWSHPVRVHMEACLVLGDRPAALDAFRKYEVSRGGRPVPHDINDLVHDIQSPVATGPRLPEPVIGNIGPNYRKQAWSTQWANALLPRSGNRGDQLYVISGLPGIGKSFIAQEMLRHLVEKRRCRAISIPYNDSDYTGLGFFALIRLLGLERVPTADPISAVASFFQTLVPRTDLVHPDVLVLFIHDADALPVNELNSFVRLLQRVPSLRIVATASRPLGIGEYLLPLEPLDKDESRNMFLEGARRAGYPIVEDPPAPTGMEGLIPRPTSTAIDRILELCGGIPAAIDYLAGLTPTHGPVQLLALLNSGNVPDPIGRVIEAQLDGIALEERALFSQLSVFRHGFEIGLAAAVCNFPAIEGLLDELLGRGLLITHDVAGARQLRIRPEFADYAASLLSAEHTAAVQLRKAMVLAAQWDKYRSEPGTDTFGPLCRTWREVNDSLSWTLDHADLADFRWKLAAALAEVANVEGLFEIGWRATEAAVMSEDNSNARLWCLLFAGIFADRMGRHKEAYDILKKLHDNPLHLSVKRLRPNLLNILSIICQHLGDYDDSIRFQQESIAYWRSCGRQGEVALCQSQMNLAHTLAFLNRFDEAADLLDKASGRAKGTSDALLQVLIISARGRVLMMKEEYSGARADLERARDILLAMRHQDPGNDQLDQQYSIVIHNLGCLEMRTDHMKAARGYFNEAYALREQQDGQALIGTTELELASLELREGACEKARSWLLKALEDAQRSGDKDATACCASVAALLAARSGEYTLAVAIWAGETALRVEAQIPREETERDVVERRRVQELARNALTKEAYAQADRAGASFDLDDLHMHCTRVCIPGRI